MGVLAWDVATWNVEATAAASITSTLPGTVHDKAFDKSFVKEDRASGSLPLSICFKSFPLDIATSTGRYSLNKSLN